MENSHTPAFPSDVVYNEDNDYTRERIVNEGLTKREYFAAIASFDETGDSYSIPLIEAIVGRSYKNNDSVYNTAIWLEFEAKIKVMKADALLKELEK